MKNKVKLQLIELEDDNYHLVAPSIFGIKDEMFWIIDTGASKTVFDLNLKHYYSDVEGEPDQVHTAGIGDKPIQTTIGKLNDFTLGKLRVESLRVALLDLSHIKKYYMQAADIGICGLLGGDFLSMNKAVIDYKKKVMTLQSPNTLFGI